MALIKVKDVKEAIALMMNILEKLDEIYHALKDANKEYIVTGKQIGRAHV